jgi:hypothetical protein
MTRQMILDLPVRPALGRDDFFVSPSNLTALAMVDAPQRWPGGKLLLLGPAGSGKSHLAEVFAHDRGAAIVPAAELFEMPVPPGILVIEDAEQAAGRAEELLFHIHNAVLAMDGLLLLTAARPPGDCGSSERARLVEPTRMGQGPFPKPVKIDVCLDRRKTTKPTLDEAAIVLRRGKGAMNCEKIDVFQRSGGAETLLGGVGYHHGPDVMSPDLRRRGETRRGDWFLAMLRAALDQEISEAAVLRRVARN